MVQLNPQPCRVKISALPLHAMSRDAALPLRPRRPAEALVTLVIALALLLPMVLGPALVPLARAWGGVDSHVCACGMARGTCGCPECEKLEHERLREHAPRPYPVLRAYCGGDEVASGYSALPPATPLPKGVLLPRSPRERVALERPAEAFSRDLAEPATRPPRLARA
jgi:hypothetical protein